MRSSTLASAPPVTPQPLISDTVALMLVGVGISLLVGILSYLFKRTISEIDQKIKNQASRHDEAEREINDLKTALLQSQIKAKDEFVGRADFITRMALIDGQLEKIAVGVQQNQGLIYAIRERTTSGERGNAFSDSANYL
jgi:hypothetical protein